MQKLHIHVLGGTAAADRFPSDVEGMDEVIMPRAGKIEEIVRYEVARDVRDAFGPDGNGITITEEAEVLDSSQYKARHIMDVVSTVRRMFRDMEKGENLMLIFGTDTAEYLMQALAEGVTPSMLVDRNIIGYCSQQPAPNRTVGSTEQEYPRNDRSLRDFDNMLHLITRDEMHPEPGKPGRIGMFCGGLLMPGRGLRKMDTEREQPFQYRYGTIAVAGKNPDNAYKDAYVPGKPDWFFTQMRNSHRPRGKKPRYKLRDGIETWSFDPTSNYANLPASMWGMVHAPEHFQHLLKDGGSRLNGMVVQAPGSRNVSEEMDDLQCIHEAAMIGLEANVPVAVIAEPLLPHWGKSRSHPSVYGGDFDRIRSVLDGIAQKDKRYPAEKSPVVSGGRLLRAEAKVELARIMHRARETHSYEGWELIEYVQKSFHDYERFVTGEIPYDEFLSGRD